MRWLRGWLRESAPWFAAVGLANAAMGVSSVLIPLLLSRVLGGSVENLGWLAAAVSLVGVLGSLFWGRLSDAAHRRKPFVVASYAAVCLVHAGLAFVGTFPALLALNMTLNLFWVANAAVTVLILIENRPEARWEGMISHLNQIGALGWVAGLGLGSGLLATLSPWLGEAGAMRAAFVVIAALALAATATAALTVPRTVPRFTARRFRGVALALGNFLVERARFSPLHLYHRLRPIRAWQRLVSPRGFRPGTKRFLAATLLGFLAFGLFGIPLPLALSDRFGMSPPMVFAFFVVQHAAIVVAYPLASRRTKRLGNRRVQIAAVGLRTVLFAVVAGLAAGPWRTPTAILVGAFVLYGFSWSYFQLSGVALTSRLAKPANRGLALGVYNAAAGWGWILAGIGSGLISERFGFAAAFAAGAGLSAVALAVLHWVPEPTVGEAAAEGGGQLRRRQAPPSGDEPRPRAAGQPVRRRGTSANSTPTAAPIRAPAA